MREWGNGQPDMSFCLEMYKRMIRSEALDEIDNQIRLIWARALSTAAAVCMVIAAAAIAGHFLLGM